jgi:hypothetical protein
MTMTQPSHSAVARVITAPEVYLFVLSVCCAWLVPVNKAAAQGGGAMQQPANPPLPCDAFRKNPDGSWTATRAVTVKASAWTISVGPDTTYAPKAINLNGVDFAKFLDDHCGK